ncbi:MAG: triple tyrosine motif-containing protein [Arenibacter sp.]
MANSKGLLEFNGAYWTLYPSPNESIMRSVHVVNDRIYTGCYMEFGYWQKNELETLEYTSLSKHIDVELIEDEEFWNIINIDDWMVFQSLKRIYIYNIKNGSVDIIVSSNRITNIFKVNREVYFQRINEGIFRIEDGKDVLFLDDDVVKNKEILNIYGRGKDLIFLTKDNGFYNLIDNKLIKSKFLSNEILSKVSIYDGIRLKDNSLALGTIANGLFILNEHGEIISQINQDQGLLNNTILAIFEDVSGIIWLGLDNGISYVDTNSPYKLYSEYKEILGRVYASTIHNGNLYLGTNQGLFYRKMSSNDDFGYINGTQGQVWCLRVIDNTLFCGHNSGTFIVKGTKVKKISDIQGTWNITSIDNKVGLLLQGNYDGLSVLEKSNNEWKLRNKIEGFNNSSRYFETLGNEIFVNHEYKGIFKLKIDSSYFAIEEVSIDSTLKGSNSGIIKYNGDLLYSYNKGVFKFDSQSQQFIKDDFLSKVYTKDEYESGKMIVDEKDNKLWIFTKSNISYITTTGLTNTKRIKNIPLTSQVRKGIVEYENISGLGDDKYLIGTESGYFIVDINVPLTKDFPIYIGQVINSSNGTSKNPQNINLNGDFKSKQNNFDISYYTPNYNRYVNTQYQFQLIGIYDDWSDWSEQSTASFENLPHGSYTFNVRSKIGDNFSSNVSSYEFNIAKPWYISNVMLSLSALGILAFLILFSNFYKRYYRKQRQELMEKNEKALKLLQMQNAQEISKLKNEKLKAEFESKSNELAASLMSNVKKNELLRAVRDKLGVAKNNVVVKSVLDFIIKSLGKNNDWEIFEEAFNNADTDFFKNLKVLHPTLTPNDLKLCSYLRLNLSTKEMAVLLNITTRSVEIKRYRLRKKLNLEHDDNLVNYILQI